MDTSRIKNTAGLTNKINAKIAKKVLFLMFLGISIPGLLSAKSDDMRQWALSGTIGGRPVQVYMEHRSDGLLAGRLIYADTGNGAGIRLLGKASEIYEGEEGTKKTRLSLTEYSGEGRETGYISGELYGDGTFDGQRWDSQSELGVTLDTRIPFKKKMAGQILHVPSNQWQGAYRFLRDHPTLEGAGGSVSIRLIKKNKLIYEFSVAVPNIAEADNIVPISGNGFSDKPTDGSYEFKAEVFKDFIYVKDIHPDTEGYFGAFTSLAGFYIKVSGGISFPNTVKNADAENTGQETYSGPPFPLQPPKPPKPEVEVKPPRPQDGNKPNKPRGDKPNKPGGVSRP